MANQQLLDYVKEQIKEGVSNEDIKKALLQNGWSDADIDEAFSALETHTSISSIPTPPSSPVSQTPTELIVQQSNATTLNSPSSAGSIKPERSVKRIFSIVVAVLAGIWFLWLMWRVVSGVIFYPEFWREAIYLPLSFSLLSFPMFVAVYKNSRYAWLWTVVFLVLILPVFSAAIKFANLNLFSVWDVVRGFIFNLIGTLAATLPLIVAGYKGARYGFFTSIIVGIIAVTVFYFTVFISSGAGFGAFLIIPLGGYYVVLSLIFLVYYLVVHKTHKVVQQTTESLQSEQVRAIPQTRISALTESILVNSLVVVITLATLWQITSFSLRKLLFENTTTFFFVLSAIAFYIILWQGYLYFKRRDTSQIAIFIGHVAIGVALYFAGLIISPILIIFAVSLIVSSLAIQVMWAVKEFLDAREGTLYILVPIFLIIGSLGLFSVYFSFSTISFNLARDTVDIVSDMRTEKIRKNIDIEDVKDELIVTKNGNPVGVKLEYTISVLNDFDLESKYYNSIYNSRSNIASQIQGGLDMNINDRGTVQGLFPTIVTVDPPIDNPLVGGAKHKVTIYATPIAKWEFEGTDISDLSESCVSYKQQKIELDRKEGVGELFHNPFVVNVIKDKDLLAISSQKYDRKMFFRNIEKENLRDCNPSSARSTAPPRYIKVEVAEPLKTVADIEAEKILNVIKPEADLFYKDSGNYGTETKSCFTEGSLFASPTIARIISEAEKAGAGVATCASDDGTSGKGVADSWAVSVQMSDGNDWCVDYRGGRGIGTVMISSNTVSCSLRSGLN